MIHKADPITILFQLAEAWYNQRLSDGGPRYAEYHPDLIIVEPWNAASSVLMMLPAIYWFVKLRSTLKYDSFVFFAILMVFLGGLGSTLFHAFRISTVFLILDILPSALLTIAIAIYFWLRILPKWWYVLLIFIPVFLLRWLVFKELPSHVSINISYGISGLLVIVPLLIVLIRTNFKKGITVLLILFSFGLALLFRQLDAHNFSFMPQGTHFLWHLFSVFGAHFMLEYLIWIDGRKFPAPKKSLL
jgi:hypothetical protein